MIIWLIVDKVVIFLNVYKLYVNWAFLEWIGKAISSISKPTEESTNPFEWYTATNCCAKTGYPYGSSIPGTR